MPILYEVSVKIPPEIAMDFEIYMTREHIPAILASGCFSNAEFARRGAGEYLTHIEQRAARISTAILNDLPAASGLIL